MTDIALLAARYASRPLLMTPSAAEQLAHRIRGLDARAFERPSRIGAILRRVGLANGGKADVGLDRRTPFAMEDDDGVDAVPLEERLAYSPRWLGDVEDTGFCWSLKDGIALICCDTVLVERGAEFCGEVWHGYDTLLLALREAMADARVKGVFLVLDTPGGVAGSGLPELAAYMRGAREAAGGKPIWVYARMACSAGYWILASGDHALAGQFAIVGSCGAVVGHENHAGALDKAGVEITTIEFPEGALKTEGARWKALSEAGRAAWQSDINELGQTFFADLQAGRPQLTQDKLLALRADAFMAQHADPERSGLALGLVDGIATEEEAFRQLVAHVSAPADQTEPAAASGARAASPAKEAVMAQPIRKPAAAAQVAQAEKALAVAKANLAKARATAQAAVADEDDDDVNDKAPATEADDEEDKESDEDDEDDEAKEKPSSAVAIATSPEAKAHPGLANAAIASGQSLAQFKATVAALGGTQSRGRLDAAMAGSRRLSPDAAKVQTGASGAIRARIERNKASRG
ncbi:MAG: S49 family peptidase [Proteobacteria bacterium]|nr:S49 family peptidase [Pseudomonadota bacterium]